MYCAMHHFVAWMALRQARHTLGAVVLSKNTSVMVLTKLSVFGHPRSKDESLMHTILDILLPTKINKGFVS